MRTKLMDSIPVLKYVAEERNVSNYNGYYIINKDGTLFKDFIIMNRTIEYTEYPTGIGDCWALTYLKEKRVRDLKGTFNRIREYGCFGYHYKNTLGPEQRELLEPYMKVLLENY